MRSLSPLNVIVACSVFCVSSITGTSLFPPYNAIQHPLQARSSEYSSASAPLNQWLEDEEKIATSKVLANVAPGGSEVPDAAPGSVIASPSKQDPDYYYQWTRDSAICVFTLLDTMDSNPESAFSPRILRFVDDYAKLQHRLQHQPNPSGTFDDLSGLGEPKFHHDAEAFNGPWGRP
ncbi:MAG: Glucoamylase, intracellular sporulation-specific [Bathelium mastoideum]|nr:MAG: Glucoamylase, intracellular sporulation-specific [Bathelium mastoideum]